MLTEVACLFEGTPTVPETSPVWAECARPEEWLSWNNQSVEVEVAEFLLVLVRLLKPRSVVETGTYHGYSALAMGQGCRMNGFGKVLTMDPWEAPLAKVRADVARNDLDSWVEVRCASSMDVLPNLPEGSIDLFYSDSELQIRGAEIRLVLDQGKLCSGGFIVAHDSSIPHLYVRRALDELASLGRLAVVHFPTPRGISIGRAR